jgi:hypothetical protein
MSRVGEGMEIVARRPDPLYHIILLAICSGVLLLALLLSIRDRTAVVVPLIGLPLPELCVTRRYTGVACPGCGMTRCFISLARGDVAGAWSYNPAGLLLFAIVAWQVPFRAVQLWRIRRNLPELQMGLVVPILFVVLGVAMIGQWALRLMGIPF